MSGIAGAWHLDGRPLDDTLLARMSAALAHRGPDGEGRWLEGPVGLACQASRVTPESASETQPLHDAQGVTLVFDGRLDNRNEILQRLGRTAAPSPEASDAALIMAAYHSAGDALPEWLAGDLALALFDARQQRLLLVRDAIGVRPLYYAYSSSTVVFASEIKALLAHPSVSPRPDEDALAEMLLGHVQDATATLFADVASVSAAHVVTVTRRGLTQRRYWDFDLHRQLRLRSFDEYAEAFRHVFAQAVARRLRSRHPAAVLVSGGLDSSSIFCLGQTLRRRGRTSLPELFGISYTSPPGSAADEQIFLRMIEAQYGVAIHRVPSASGWLSHARDFVRHVEVPLLDEQWDTMHRCLQAAQQRGARVLLTGHWGDQMLFPQAYLADLCRRGAWTTLRAHLREFPRWLTDVEPRYFRCKLGRDLLKYSLPTSLLQRARWLRDRVARRHPWYSAAVRRRALQRRWRSVPLGHAARTAHARELYEQARTAQHVVCLEWDNKMAAAYGLEMAFPFLDRDVVAFLMAMPGERVNDGGVPRAVLRAALRDVLPPAIAQRRWKADATAHVNAGVRESFSELWSLIERGGCARARGYLNWQAIAASLDAWRCTLSGQTAEAAWALSDLAGLELWLQVFFDRGGIHEPVEVYA